MRGMLCMAVAFEIFVRVVLLGEMVRPSCQGKTKAISIEGSGKSKGFNRKVQIK